MLNRLLDRRERAAQAQLRSRRSRAFTLVELLIVLLLIAILMALVIPQFFGAKQKAGDRVAQQTLTEAVQTAKVFATDNDNFADLSIPTAALTNLQTAEPNITWVTDGTAATVTNNKRTVSIAVGTDPKTTSVANSELTMVALGENGGCWYVKLYTGGTADDYGFVPGLACTPATANADTATPSGTFPDRNAAAAATPAP